MTLNDAIKKPKLAPKYCTEFDKRRLIRLEQVREQSRNIAKRIRSRIEKSKKEQLINIEKKSEMDLNIWKAKQLIDIQNKYEDTIKNWGLGHKQAATEIENEEDLKEKQKENLVVAQERGEKAAEKLKNDKLVKENKRKQIILQKQQANKNLGKVIRPKKATSLEKKSTGVNTENIATDKGVQVETTNLDLILDLESQTEINSKFNLPESNRQYTDTRSIIDRPTLRSIKFAEGSPPSKMDTPPDLNSPLDTRISDLIKKRHRNNQQYKCGNNGATIMDYQEINNGNLEQSNGVTRATYLKNGETNNKNEFKDNSPCCPNCACLNNENSTNKEYETNGYPCCKNCECETIIAPISNNQPIIDTSVGKFNNKPKERTKTIPSKRIDPNTTKKTSENVSGMTRFYDHKNKYSKTYKPNVEVEKIEKNDIITELLDDEEQKKKEIIDIRNKKAEERGQMAMEKEAAQKAYKDLMGQLPLLKRQERICECGKDKPEYHMGVDRLKEMEKNKQLKLDNAYEKLLPNTITIPRRQEEVKEPTDAQSFKSSKTDLNLCGCESKRESRKEQINTLLTKLNEKKAKLYQEIDDLKSSKSNIDLSEEKQQKEIEPQPKKSQELQKDRKRSKPKGKCKDICKEKAIKNNEKVKKKPSATKLTEKADKNDLDESISSASTSSTDSTETEYKRPTKKTKYCKSVCTKRNKALSTPQILILQNTSTQTTPQLTKNNEKPEGDIVDKGSSPICPEKHIPCECIQKKVIEIGENQCEILIKIKDADENAEVVVLNNKENDKVVEKEKGVKSKEMKTKEHVDIYTKETQTSQKILKDNTDDDNNVYLIHKPTKRRNSWREQLSSYSTTTTSYLSPPNGVGKYANMAKSSSNNQSVTDPILLNYIKKLLSKSRASIEALTVSTPSDVSTPNQSIIECESNINRKKMEGIIKLMCLRRECGGGSSSSGSSSLSMKSEQSKEFLEYSSIERSFNQKINDINKMIQRIREEKKRMLNSPYSSESEKECTSYLEFNINKQNKQQPNNKSPEKIQEKDEQEEDKKENEKLIKELLEIDFSYLEKLKISSLTENKKDDVLDYSDVDAELLARYRRLKTVENEMNLDQIDDVVSITTTTTTNKKHPPPSKGLLTAKKFNGEIIVNPHELSTIAEADSVISKLDEKRLNDEGANNDENDGENKVSPVEKGQQTSTSSTLSTDLELTEAMLQDIGMEWAIPILRKTKQSLAVSSSSSDGKNASKEIKVASSSIKSDADDCACSINFEDISSIGDDLKQANTS